MFLAYLLYEASYLDWLVAVLLRRVIVPHPSLNLNSSFDVFVFYPLPPSCPKVLWNAPLHSWTGVASEAVAFLVPLSRYLPNLGLVGGFVEDYVQGTRPS